MRRTLTILVGVAVAGALVVANATASYATVTVDTSRVSQTLLGVGSDTTYEVMSKLDLLYNESAGCAVLPPVGTTFTTFKETCIDNGQLSYATGYSSLIGTENLYHDRFTEAFPVGSGNGTKILTQFVTSAGTALPADYARASSLQSYSLPVGTTDYGVAYARNGDGWWLGRNNTFVAHNKLGPTTNATSTQLKNVFIGNSAGKCLTTFSNSLKSAFKTATGLPAVGNQVAPFATQVGSGSGKDFLSKIDPSLNPSDATFLQNCIPQKFKDGDLTNGEHVIQENFARPICNQPGTIKSWQNRAVFPYGFARFVQNHGATTGCTGRLQKVDGIAPSITSIGAIGPKAYPLTGYVYNYMALPNAIDVTDPSSWTGTGHYLATLDYLDPIHGWLCKTNHAKDPFTGISYRTEIDNTLANNGFSPLKLGVVGGAWTGSSFCRDSSNT